MNDNIPFFKPSFSQDEEDAVLRVLRSGWLTTGPEALAFENEFSRFIGGMHCLAVNSATSGLMLAYDAFGVGPGTSILTTPYTFASTATAARHLGADIRWADIESDSYNIDPNRIEEALKKHPEIRAIVPVHVAGLPCDMEAICYLGKKYGKAVIEDAAHAFPSRTPGGFAGTLGDAGVWSFYATKTITTGEGGMVHVRGDEAEKRIKLMRSHGINRTIWDRYTSVQASWVYDVVEDGWKCNLPDILAAIGREQLKKADSFLDQRSKTARKYAEAFRSCPSLELPPDGTGNAWHLFLLRIIPEKLTIGRDEFAAELQKQGLGISVHFIPHFELTYFKKRYNLTREEFPCSARRYETTITLPFWPGMSEEQEDRVIRAVISTADTYARS